MNVKELSQEQLIELKGNIIQEQVVSGKRKTFSWLDFINADNVITDEEVFKRYKNVEFSNKDFFCTGRIA